MQINRYNSLAATQMFPAPGSRKAPQDFSKELGNAAGTAAATSAIPQPSPLFSSQTIPLLHQDEINFFSRSFTEAYQRQQGNMASQNATGRMAVQI